MLDLTDRADRDRAQALARESDVLVENFRSGVTERFGLDHDTVRQANPGIIYCSITGCRSRRPSIARRRHACSHRSEGWAGRNWPRRGMVG